jgi:hypothetical protein
MPIETSSGDAYMRLIASTITCVLTVFGRKMMVNVDNGGSETMVNWGDPEYSCPSRKSCV